MPYSCNAEAGSESGPSYHVDDIQAWEFATGGRVNSLVILHIHIEYPVDLEWRWEGFISKEYSSTLMWYLGLCKFKGGTYSGPQNHLGQVWFADRIKTYSEFALIRYSKANRSGDRCQEERSFYSQSPKKRRCGPQGHKRKHLGLSGPEREAVTMARSLYCGFCKNGKTGQGKQLKTGSFK